jgi:hypothetical protein
MRSEQPLQSLEHRLIILTSIPQELITATRRINAQGLLKNCFFGVHRWRIFQS